jgi:hypothetical protein
MEIATKTDLENLKAELVKEIAGLINHLSTPNPYVKSKEAQKIIGCSSTKLEALRYNGKLPYKKIGGTVYFKRTDLMNLFEEDISIN